MRDEFTITEGKSGRGPKPETIFWRDTVRPALHSFGIIRRVENAVENGMSDVIYCLHRGDRIGVSGWIELKHAWEWPKRADTLFRFDHYTVDQANFIADWGALRQRACVLARVADEFLLVPSEHAHELQRGVTRRRFYDIAAVYGDCKFPTGPVLLWLTER